MGIPVQGIDAEILDDEGAPVTDGRPGTLALRVGWPSMFAAYLNHPEAYDSRFSGGFYLTGDKAHRDRDGYYWFVGRLDDVINTAGHLVSPFEVESSLLGLPEVAESAVVGAPDPLLFEKVVAFVRLKPSAEPSPELDLRIRTWVANKVSTIATPQDVVFVPAIPKNASGKIMRRVLRARYLGEDPGDLSTLEEGL